MLDQNPHTALDQIRVEAAFGSASDMGKAENATLAWKDLVARLARPHRDQAHTLEQYAALDKAGKTRAKAAPGFIFCGHLDAGARNKSSVSRRNLLTLDADNLQPDDRMVKAILTGSDAVLAAAGIDFPCIIHSTRSDTPEAPRFRIFAPVSRPMMPDEFEAVSRHVARGIDPEQSDRFDAVSFRIAQMMFLASVSSDQHFLFREVRTGEVVDVDAILAGEVRTYRTAKEQEKDARESAKSAARANRIPTMRPACLGAVAKPAGSDALAGTEDPRNRRGIVGSFCTVHDVHSAIATYLTGVYEPHGGDRYTYVAGSTAGGLVVYDGGLLAFSNHSTDPISGTCANAFDIVRAHLFGNLDSGSSAFRSNEQPSYAAMRNLALQDPRVKSVDVRRKKDMKMNANIKPQDFAVAAPSDRVYSDDDQATMRELEASLNNFNAERDVKAKAVDPVAEIEAVIDAATIPVAEPARDKEIAEAMSRGDVFDILKLKDSGKGPSPEPYNANMILRLDSRFAGKLRFNDLVAEPVIYGKIDHGVENLSDLPEPKTSDGIRMDDGLLDILRVSIAAPLDAGGYGLNIKKEDFYAGLRTAAMADRYNPLIEEIESFAWDGVPRIDRFFIDNFGCPEDAYHREASPLLFLGALDRLYNPGSKFDHMFIFEGATDLGKSYVINSLALGRSVEVDAKDLADAKKRMEQLAGSWLVEIPELSGFDSVGHRAMKAMVTMRKDRARMSYDRFAVDMPRSTVLIGTTNEWQVLTDPTGNRRYLIVKWRRKPDYRAIEEVVPQLWAEALVRYRSPDMMKELRIHSDEAQAQAKILQEGRRAITYEEEVGAQVRDWLDTEHVVETDDRSFGRYVTEGGRIVVLRDRFCLDQVWMTVLERDLRDKGRRESIGLSKAVATLADVTSGIGVMTFPDLPTNSKQRFFVVDRSGDVTIEKLR